MRGCVDVAHTIPYSVAHTHQHLDHSATDSTPFSLLYHSVQCFSWNLPRAKIIINFDPIPHPHI